jgi:hypothetical protein
VDRHRHPCMSWRPAAPSTTSGAVSRVETLSAAPRTPPPLRLTARGRCSAVLTSGPGPTGLPGGHGAAPAAGCEPGRRTYRALSPHRGSVARHRGAAAAPPRRATGRLVLPPGRWTGLPLPVCPRRGQTADRDRLRRRRGNHGVELPTRHRRGLRRRARCERPARAELQRVDGAFDCPSPVTALRCGSAGGDESRARREADDARFGGPAQARIRSLRLVTVSHFGYDTGRATFRDIVVRTDGERIQVLRPRALPPR